MRARRARQPGRSCVCNERVPVVGVARHWQVGALIAEAVLSRRSVLSKSEQKELALRAMGRRQQSVRLHEGALEKKPVSSTVGQWKRRWLVLTADAIEWYAAAGAAEPKGRLPLSGESVAQLDDADSPTTLTIKPAHESSTQVAANLQHSIQSRRARCVGPLLHDRVPTAHPLFWLS